MKKVRRKRIIGVLAAAVLSLGLTACQSTTQEESKQESQQQESAQESSDAATKEQEPSGQQTTEESSQEESEEPSQEIQTNKEYVIKDFEIPDTEALQMIRDMKIGWNLGNAFDAIDCNWLTDELDYESAWNGEKTTPELIAALKEAGFRTIRIPVSWHNHLTDEENYTISEAWLERVAEVVDYCMDQDMYVIIDIHHDNSESYMYPDSAHLDQSVKYVKSIWTQLAERFQDYGEKLLFAGVNEPRLVGHANEWWIDPENEDCKDAISCVNVINQTFVDTVRASGGNNATRYLICPGYDASPEGALNSGFVLPTDPVDNDHRIILSVHAYTPYSFALEDPGTDTWSSDTRSDLVNMVSFMNDIYNAYVAKGIPVIIDEFGAQEKNGNLAARVDFAGCYVAQARARGITCIWWDNNLMKGDGERFGIIDRKTQEWAFPEIMEAMMNHAE